MLNVPKLNAAQQLRAAIGIEAVQFDSAPRSASTTKSGPGRRHVSGHQKAAPSKAPTGAGPGFVQHINPAANARRAAKADSSARQYRKDVKAARRIAAAGG